MPKDREREKGFEPSTENRHSATGNDKQRQLRGYALPVSLAVNPCHVLSAGIESDGLSVKQGRRSDLGPIEPPCVACGGPFRPITLRTQGKPRPSPPGDRPWAFYQPSPRAP
jgi:hypothetical protein